jgi:drug/metabolite transporter (DMT)-like permease
MQRGPAAQATSMPQTVQPSNVKAAAWMSGWLGLMLVMMVAGRESARELSIVAMMEVRTVIGLLMLLPLVQAGGGLTAMRTARPGLHVARNVVHYAAQYCWFLALTMIPLSQLIAIEFTMPIWAAILAVSFLGERMNRWKSLSLLLGMVGVVLIVRPVGADIDPGQLIILIGAVGFGISVVVVKSLTRTDSALQIIFWMQVIQSVMGLAPAILYWSWPSATVWGWLLLVAFSGTFSHYCIARAMLHADATVVVPLDFARLPLSVALGWLIYAEALDIYTACGAALILLGNLFNLKPPRRPARA